jgi:hypothetical protein
LALDKVVNEESLNMEEFEEEKGLFETYDTQIRVYQSSKKKDTI